jgi:hypothetical protein
MFALISGGIPRFLLWKADRPQKLAIPITKSTHYEHYGNIKAIFAYQVWSVQHWNRRLRSKYNSG